MKKSKVSQNPKEKLPIYYAPPRHRAKIAKTEQEKTELFKNPYVLRFLFRMLEDKLLLTPND